tara:strand:- start:3597 stop:4442 length:846 start_codon:yes stop_codon:yes gene_type:complete
MSCPDCRAFSTSKNLNIARGFFGVLASVLLLSTLILFGINMDYANYPGSNMVFKIQTTGDNEGDFMTIKDKNGFQIKTDGCHGNFPHVNATEDGVATGYCGSVEDDKQVELVIMDAEGVIAAGKPAFGWTIMPPCTKTNKLTDCAPFGVDSLLSGLGQAGFGVLALNAVLTAAHTGVTSSRPDSLCENSTTAIIFWLNIVWGILSFSLFGWSALGWRGLCDKIDTGLGRQFEGERGCATTYCTISYGMFFASFATAMVVYRIPGFLVMFGVLGLESVDDGL